MPLLHYSRHFQFPLNPDSTFNSVLPVSCVLCCVPPASQPFNINSPPKFYIIFFVLCVQCGKCNMQLNQQKYIQFYNSFNIKHLIGFYIFFLLLKRCKLPRVKLKRTQKSLFIHFCKRLWLRRSSKRHTVRLNGRRGNTLNATLRDSLFLLEINILVHLAIAISLNGSLTTLPRPMITIHFFNLWFGCSKV